MTTRPNAASDANKAQAEFAVLLERSAATGQPCPSQEQSVMLPAEYQARENAEELAYLAEWKVKHPAHRAPTRWELGRLYW